MEVTVIKPKNKKGSSLISSIVLLILGIFLAFNSEGVLNIIFDIIGAMVLLYGILCFSRYFSQKKQFGTDDNEALMSAIVAITVGLLIILLSNILTNAIQIVTGIWLIYIGISKLNLALQLKGTKAYTTNLISAIILCILGIYTIVAQNVVFVIIGIILIIYSLIDIIKYFTFGKKSK